VRSADSLPLPRRPSGRRAVRPGGTALQAP
jgi:hypothetical protein